MTKSIQTLIVDDERYAREELIHLLNEYDTISVIADADSGETAIMKALQHQPDVVFLDVEMPGMTGMEVAKSLLELKKTPFIVFATAHPQFAAEAFRYEAIDYLLKPYDEQQLRETVQRMEIKCTAIRNVEPMKPIAKLAVEAEGEIIYLLPSDILFIYREEKVVKIVSRIGEFETKIALKDLEKRLSFYSFFRIHKSYLVNLDYVVKLSPWFNGAYQVELKGYKEKLSVSRNYVKALRQILEL